MTTVEPPLSPTPTPRRACPPAPKRPIRYSPYKRADAPHLWLALTCTNDEASQGLDVQGHPYDPDDPKPYYIWNSKNPIKRAFRNFLKAKQDANYNFELEQGDTILPLTVQPWYKALPHGLPPKPTFDDFKGYIRLTFRDEHHINSFLFCLESNCHPDLPFLPVHVHFMTSS